MKNKLLLLMTILLTHKAIFAEGMDLFKQHERMLCDAIQNNRVEKVGVLLTIPYTTKDIECKHHSKIPALNYAAELHIVDIKIVKMLIDSGFPLYSVKDDHPILFSLVFRSINPENKPAERRFKTVLELLIKQGLNLNEQYLFYWSPSNRKPRYTIAHKHMIELANSAGTNRFDGGLEILSFLIDNGLDIHSLDSHKNNVFHYLASSISKIGQMNEDHIKLIEYLKNLNVDLNQKNSNGLTAAERVLYHAAYYHPRKHPNKFDGLTCYLENEYRKRTPGASQSYRARIANSFKAKRIISKYFYSSNDESNRSDLPEYIRDCDPGIFVKTLK